LGLVQSYAFFLKQEKPFRLEPGMNHINKKVNPDPSPPSLLGSEIVRIYALFLFQLNRHTALRGFDFAERRTSLTNLLVTSRVLAHITYMG